jgi:hypothetical protein
VKFWLKKTDFCQKKSYFLAKKNFLAEKLKKTDFYQKKAIFWLKKRNFSKKGDFYKKMIKRRAV